MLSFCYDAQYDTLTGQIQHFVSLEKVIFL